MAKNQSVIRFFRPTGGIYNEMRQKTAETLRISNPVGSAQSVQIHPSFKGYILDHFGAFVQGPVHPWEVK